MPEEEPNVKAVYQILFPNNVPKHITFFSIAYMHPYQMMSNCVCIVQF